MFAPICERHVGSIFQLSSSTRLFWKILFDALFLSPLSISSYIEQHWHFAVFLARVDVVWYALCVRSRLAHWVVRKRDSCFSWNCFAARLDWEVFFLASMSLFGSSLLRTELHTVVADVSICVQSRPCLCCFRAVSSGCKVRETGIRTRR